jgi:hypothetical protein
MVCVRFSCIWTITQGILHRGALPYKITACSTSTNAAGVHETALPCASAAPDGADFPRRQQRQVAWTEYTHNGVSSSALLAFSSRPTGSTVNNAQTRNNRPIPSNVPSGLDTWSPVPPELRISTKRRPGSLSVVYYPYTRHSPMHQYFAYLTTPYKC